MEKLCPLMTAHTGEPTLCVHGRCAWYMPIHRHCCRDGRCALQMLGAAMSELIGGE